MKQQKSLQPHVVFLILGLLFGSLLIVLNPVGAGYDETTHVARIWEISHGELIPNRYLSSGPNFPSIFFELSYRSKNMTEVVEPGFIADNINRKIDWDVFDDLGTRSEYSPIIYLVQAFIMGLLGRVFDAPALIIYYLLRFSELAGYLLLVFLAIRMIPFGKWVLTVLGLAPMALYQASSISGDCYSNAIGLLFIGWVLHLANVEKIINRKQFLITLLILVMLFSVKINVVFLIPLLFLIPKEKYYSNGQRRLLILLTIVLFVILTVGWNLLVISTYTNKIQENSASPLQQLAFILKNPLIFIGYFFKNLGQHGIEYLKQWIGAYGYNSGVVPAITYWIFLAALAAAFILDAGSNRNHKKTRWIMGITFLFSTIATFLVMYLAANAVGSSKIEGIQGRYFTFIMTLLILSLLPVKEIKLNQKITKTILIAGSVFSLAAYCVGLYLSFYVVCGSSQYTRGYCYQPVYKNWNPDANVSVSLDEKTTLEQSFTSICEPIKSIQVWPYVSDSATETTTTFTLVDAVSGDSLSTSSISSSELIENQWNEVLTPSIGDSNGNSYVLKITTNATNPDQSAHFLISERHEYEKGQFIIIGEVKDFDLIFRYGCDVR